MSVELARSFGEAGVRWQGDQVRWTQVVAGERRPGLPDLVEQPLVEVVEALLVACVDRGLGVVVELLRAASRSWSRASRRDRPRGRAGGRSSPSRRSICDRLGRLQIHNDGANPQVSCFS
jgi:hypothetical protein